jgi:hypothetical protein
VLRFDGVLDRRLKFTVQSDMENRVRLRAFLLSIDVGKDVRFVPAEAGVREQASKAALARPVPAVHDRKTGIERELRPVRDRIDAGKSVDLCEAKVFVSLLRSRRSRRRCGLLLPRITQTVCATEEFKDLH